MHRQLCQYLSGKAARLSPEGRSEGKNMKQRKTRWILILLAGLLAVICSTAQIAVPYIRRSCQDLSEAVAVSSRTLRQMLPEFNGNEKLYREAQDEMNLAVLRGFAYQLARDGEISAEEFEAKCARYGVLGGFLSAPDGEVLCTAGDDVKARYDSDPSGGGTFLFYSKTLPDGRVLVLEFSGEELDVLIDYSVSWINRVQGIHFGQTGFACVLAQDGTIISHPEPRLLADTDVHFELKRPTQVYEGLALYDLETSDIKDSYNYSMVGKVLSFQNYKILCGVTLPEFVRSVVGVAMCFPLLLLLVLYVIIRYLLLLRTEPRKFVLRRLSVAGMLGLILVFFSSLFLQAVNETASQMITVDDHAENAVDALQRNEEISKYISDWFDCEQLRKCRVAADILYDGRADLSRSDVQAISEMLGSRWCFLYNRSGNVALTDSPYDHLSLYRSSRGQSAAFRPLLDGLEFLIQEPMPDDVSGKEMQYVGVSVRDENDLADGFVQIAVDRRPFQKMINTLSIQQEIENIGFNKSETAFAVETPSGIIRYSTTPEIVGLAIPISTFDAFGDSYNGYVNYNGITYIAGIRRSDPYIITAMIPKHSVTSVALKSSLCLSVLLLAALAVIAALLPKEPAQKKLRGKEVSKTEEALSRILQRMLFILCLLLTLQYFASAYNSQEYLHNGTALIEFIMHGNWQREPNLFSVAYSLFIAAFVAASFGLVTRVLNQLAKIGSPHVQTLCYLIRNILKYSCVLAVLYYCLAQFGVDTRTLLASAGIMSLVIGLGAKDLITDILAGLFIIFERTLEVGDFVTVDGFSGFVKEIGLRTTKIGLQADVKIFNNSDIKKVVNRKGSTQTIYLELGISLDESLERVEAVFKRELPLLKDSITGALDAPFCSGVSDLSNNLCKLRIAMKCEASKQFAARAELLRGLKLIAERNSICLSGKQIDVLELDEAPEAGAQAGLPVHPDLSGSSGDPAPVN